MRNHRMALMAGCLITTSMLAGAALASTQNPDSADASIASIDDGFGSRLTGSSGDKTGYSKYDDIGDALATINRGLGDYDTGGAGGHISGTPVSDPMMSVASDTADPTDLMVDAADVSLN